MGKQLPFISVVIPAYNEEKYLPKCLKALQQQTYPKDRYHILVVDNNSIDKTSSLAKKFGAEVITEKQQGHVYSFNTGLQSATGDIIAITDADSQPAKNWLKKIATIFEDTSIVGVTGTLKFETDSAVVGNILTRLYQMFLYVHFACKKPHCTGPNMAIRSSAFKQLKSVDTRYKISGDVEIGMRLRRLGRVKFEKNLSTTTSFRRFDQSITGCLKDVYKYTNAYIYAIWLERPPRVNLTPIR